MSKIFSYEINWRLQLLESLGIFIFGGFFISVIWCTRCWESLYWFTITFTYSGFFWVFLWKGSETIVEVLDPIYSWLEHPVKRFVSSVTLIAIYTTAVVFGMDFFYDVVIFGMPISEAPKELNGSPLITTIFVTLGINAFMHGRAFLLEWRQLSVDMEKLKTEQVSTQYQSLRNQVNPHFLFNSLNALTSLVYDDQKKAVEFIRKLSQVYRYVLDKKDEELVPLEDEIDFMRNFIFLQQIRFGDNLRISLSNGKVDGYLPPLALQILVENAIKHNVISEKNPLTIDVKISEDYCMIENTIKEKLDKDSTGIGLSNLKARYQYLSKKEIIVENDGHRFLVRIPILHLEE